jgi:plasmid stabilization system protein ParE
VPEARSPEVREILLKPYRIWFRVLAVEDRIEVLVVFHGAREVR